MKTGVEHIEGEVSIEVETEVGQSIETEVAKTSTPTRIDNIKELWVGKVFKSVEEAEQSYKEYGANNGFGIRKRTQHKDKSNTELLSVTFSCSCEGTYKKKDEVVDHGQIKRSTSTMKTGCAARMRVVRRDSEVWLITIFSDEHNHMLVTPSKRILIRSHRQVPTAAKALAESFSQQNLQLSKVPAIFGGNVAFDKRDIYNHMRNVRSVYYEDGDAGGVRNYFKKMSLENPHFFYSIQCDSEGRAANFFWIDARSRMAYSRFGDTVTFDTTYRTNKYKLPFAPFIGVNHHRQSIHFGGCLLENEVEDTFVWLFETWLEAMGGVPPISIITDQDLAMTAAIKKVFPNTRHRFCLWHIKKKFAEKVSHIFFKKSKFKQAVKSCTRFVKTTEEFEVKWGALMRDYSLEDHAWLKHLYEIRQSWIPIYCRSTFFAGMNSTQRSECHNAFFNRFVTCKTNLREFVMKYDQALESVYVSERKEDYISIYKKRVLTTTSPILAHAASIYTRNIYEKISKECVHVPQLRADERKVDGDVHTFEVRYRSGIPDEWVVTFNIVTKECFCGYQLFEFSGILCRHMLTVFERYYIDDIPAHFILKRWTKEANRSKVVASDGLEMQDEHFGSQAARVSDLCRRFTQLAYMGGESTKGYKVLSNLIDKAYEEIREINDGLLQKENEDEVRIQENESTPGPIAPAGSRIDVPVLLDPRISQTKGRKRTQGSQSGTSSKDARIKSGLELCTEKKKPRICKSCKGHGHDSRNCPTAPKIVQNTGSRDDGGDRDQIIG
ncbi:protein FAR1-RELATED SEQUENCE 5-like [Iris pallida]|uniref:Protein FAR1-RELATED SEQUENCE 5-like n=1 Tax=Iris pallida TaxID=29817 RepID=A0AAX6EQX7_IRIPA|nr:protein FAR1-RELATED SEQUENCE 5-like [Iris pallida]